MPTPAHLALTPEIEDFRRQFERLADEADALVAPLSDEQFAWQSSPATWSIAQCIDHLNVTARLYLPQLDEGIANAIRQGLYGEGPFKYWWLGRMLVRMMEPFGVETTFVDICDTEAVRKAIESLLEEKRHFRRFF